MLNKTQKKTLAKTVNDWDSWYRTKQGKFLGPNWLNWQIKKNFQRQALQFFHPGGETPRIRVGWNGYIEPNQK